MDSEERLAKAIQEVYNNLTIKQKLSKLDAKLGIGIGAAKERKRLLGVKNG